ncbi:hypothetical protein SARC_03123 [Sphaeroforma arctica JP610]|uniref:DNA mismatch repair protein MutS core domain-containing protein n=1 Tax=Sphaeroforma arctica JP610 TaxID=667725 RepID=A0A0L0G6M7_9EUKA|nr:hypothetical protein SARC_03123 [Sphaeroforma arctica JP610]KNC84662.1 hypothetical protein SARC_03123 [Sphaeroforma arctica JP610]|eukprot:XP_014158564.1 hypothetical protein SARC_03123 [Sphaeroforma arctica JP610]
MRYSQTVRTWATRATRSNTRIELNPRLSNYTQLVLDGGRQSIRCLSVQTPCSRVKSCVGKSICCSEYTGTQFYSLLRRSLHTQAKRSCEGGAPMCEFRGTTVHAHTLRIVKASIRTAVPRLHAHSTPTPNATAQGKATVEEIMSVDTPLERFNLTDTLTVKRRVTKRRKMLAQKGSGITETNLRSRDINGDNMPLQAGKTVEELGSSPSEVEYILQKPKSKRGAATPTTTEQTQSATIQALESKELESGLIATEELKKDTVRTTELKKQWDSFRAQYPGHLLLYQCGDFYEIYDEDADLVETLTNLKVTEKNSTGFKRMAGFPLRVVHDWVARLLQCGVGKIAVVEQVQPPTDSTNRSDVEGEKRAPHGLAGGVIEGSFGAKTKILPRQVVRVYTPGTLYDTNEAGGRHLVSLAVIGSDSGQSPHNHENGDATYTHQGVSNSYGSARHGGDFNINGDGEVKFGVCYVDLETSELHVSSSADVDHLDEVLSRLNVAEVLLTQEASEYIGRHYPSLATRESVCHTVLEKTWFADTRATVFDAFAALHRGVRAEVEEGKADAPVLKEGIPIESEENASEKVPKVGGSVRELLGMSGARAVSDTTSTQAQSHAHAHAHSQTGAHPSARDTRDSAALDRRHVNDMELMAMSALLRYIAHTHPGDKPRLQWPSRHTVSHHMVMDSDTRKALELVTSNALLQCDDGFAKHTNRLSTGVGSGTLYSVLNRCKTYGGRRLLRARIVSPSTDVGIINQYLSSVAVLKGLPNTNNRLRRIMKECTDMERTLQHINIRKVDWPALRYAE